MTKSHFYVYVYFSVNHKCVIPQCFSLLVYQKITITSRCVSLHTANKEHFGVFPLKVAKKLYLQQHCTIKILTLQHQCKIVIIKNDIFATNVLGPVPQKTLFTLSAKRPLTDRILGTVVFFCSGSDPLHYKVHQDGTT